MKLLPKPHSIFSSTVNFRVACSDGIFAIFSSCNQVVAIVGGATWSWGQQQSNSLDRNGIMAAHVRVWVSPVCHLVGANFLCCSHWPAYRTKHCSDLLHWLHQPKPSLHIITLKTDSTSTVNWFTAYDEAYTSVQGHCERVHFDLCGSAMKPTTVFGFFSSYRCSLFFVYSAVSLYCPQTFLLRQQIWKFRSKSWKSYIMPFIPVLCFWIVVYQGMAQIT